MVAARMRREKKKWIGLSRHAVAVAVAAIGKCTARAAWGPVEEGVRRLPECASSGAYVSI